MKRRAATVALLAALGGCVTTDKSLQPSNAMSKAKEAPGMVGPLGEPVAVRAGTKPTKADEAAITRAKAESKADGKGDSGIQQVNWPVGTGKAAGIPTPAPGAVAAVGALPVGGPGQYNGLRTSIRFVGPAGMKVAWFANDPSTPNGFTPTMVEAPGRYNFPQGGVFRLKLSAIANRPGLELYPTMEVIPAGPKTATFLAHSAVPINLSEEDLEQVTAGNLVTKVVYLPDPQFQDLAAAGPDEVVSSRLEPGVDPIVEARRRGSVLAVLRIGNIDMEMGNTPGLMVQPNSPFPTGPGGRPSMAPMPTPMPLPPAPLPSGAIPTPTKVGSATAGRASASAGMDLPPVK